MRCQECGLSLHRVHTRLSGKVGFHGFNRDCQQKLTTSSAATRFSIYRCLQCSVCRCIATHAMLSKTGGKTGGDDAVGNTPRWQLPPALQLHILSFLPANDRALSGRLVSPDAAAALTGPDHCTASLSQPLPPHAAPWAVEAGQQHVRQLPFRHKLQLLCTAAASGSEVNLEVALALLQPSIFPELWYAGGRMETAHPYNDPGVAAVEAGHPQLLGWLLDRCPGHLKPGSVLTAAAKHCDLAGLQAAWELLGSHPVSTTHNGGWHPAAVASAALAAAAGSATPDAVAKMEWLMSKAGLGPGTAAAAARSGDLGRLRWLRDRGCPMGGYGVLQSALQHADLAVAQWLVDEAGCKLPAAGSNQEWQRLPRAAAGTWEWPNLLRAAASARGAVAKLQWLVERGAPPLHRAEYEQLAELVRVAVGAGRVDVLQHLRSLPGLTPQQDQWLLQEAFDSALTAMRIPVFEYLRRAGMELTPAAYSRAAGSLDVVRWLACEVSGGPSTDDLIILILEWPWDAPSHSRDLLQAVQLLVGQVGCTDWGVQQRQAERVVYAAARRGDLALVQYLLQQLPGYQPGGKVLAAAAVGGCEALLEWLVEQHPGCMAGPWAESAYIAPAKSGQRGTLTALRRLGVPWGAEDVLVQAVEHWYPVPVLRWLVEQGAPVGDGMRLETAVALAVEQYFMRKETAALLWSVAAAASAAAAVGKS